MEDPKDKIYSLLEKVVVDLGVEASNFSVERPKDSSHGDFSSNIAMVLAKELKKNPLELAKEISAKLESSEFAKIEEVAPGFINFYLSPKYLQSQVQSIIEKGEEYGSSTLGKGKKASIEFVSANPTGPLHIGNARGGPLGDTIANVLAKVGYSVKREYLHNDVGGQVDRLGEAIYFTLHPDQKAVDYEMQYQGEYIKELSGQVK